MCLPKFSTNVTKTVQPFVMSSHRCFAGSSAKQHSGPAADLIGFNSSHRVFSHRIRMLRSQLRRKSVLTAFPILLLHQRQQRHNTTLKRDHNLPKRCFSDSRETIWRLRVDFLQERVLSQWENFTIWNAGKQGRKLYRCLSPTNQKKVRHRRAK